MSDEISKLRAEIREKQDQKNFWYDEAKKFEAENERLRKIIDAGSCSWSVFRRDDDCHWYLVPAERDSEFRELMERIEGKDYMECPEDFDSFNAAFGEMRIECPTHYRVQVIQR